MDLDRTDSKIIELIENMEIPNDEILDMSIDISDKEQIVEVPKEIIARL